MKIIFDSFCKNRLYFIISLTFIFLSGCKSTSQSGSEAKQATFQEHIPDDFSPIPVQQSNYNITFNDYSTFQGQSLGLCFVEIRPNGSYFKDPSDWFVLAQKDNGIGGCFIDESSVPDTSMALAKTQGHFLFFKKKDITTSNGESFEISHIDKEGNPTPVGQMSLNGSKFSLSELCSGPKKDVCDFSWNPNDSKFPLKIKITKQ